jgi:hypothetical protein
MLQTKDLSHQATGATVQMSTAHDATLQCVSLPPTAAAGCAVQVNALGKVWDLFLVGITHRLVGDSCMSHLTWQLSAIHYGAMMPYNQQVNAYAA